MDIDYTKLQTIIETREKFENDEYGKQVVSYLVQKKPMIVSKKGYDRLTNFKKFGTPASGTAAARKGTISHLPGIIFDEGNREDLVETKLTKDADAIELEKLDKAKLGIEEKKEKKKVEGLMEEFGLQTEYTVSYLFLLIFIELQRLFSPTMIRILKNTRMRRQHSKDGSMIFIMQLCCKMGLWNAILG